jgi:catechol 2,3-dioxygenase-like lactoylglutathione lyase family enzyme
VGENGRWQLTDLQRFLVFLTVVLAFFLAAMALGSANVILFVGAGFLLVLAAVGVFLFGLRQHRRQPVQGTGYVISVQKPPADNIQGRCDMRMRVNLPGQPSVDLKVRVTAVPVTRWPVQGQVLPIEAPPSNPRQIRVRWDLVELGYVRAPDVTPPRQSTGSPLDAMPIHTPAPTPVRVHTEYAQAPVTAPVSPAPAQPATERIMRLPVPDPELGNLDDIPYSPTPPRQPRATRLVTPEPDIYDGFDEYYDDDRPADRATVLTGSLLPAITKPGEPAVEAPAKETPAAEPPAGSTATGSTATGSSAVGRPAIGPGPTVGEPPTVREPKGEPGGPGADTVPTPRSEPMPPSWEIEPNSANHVAPPTVRPFGTPPATPLPPRMSPPDPARRAAPEPETAASYPEDVNPENSYDDEEPEDAGIGMDDPDPRLVLDPDLSAGFGPAPSDLPVRNIPLPRGAEEPAIRFFNSGRADTDSPALGGGLVVSDLDRSLRFYRDLLGFTVVYTAPGSAVVEYGGARILLQLVADFSGPDRRTGHLHLEVEDLDMAFADLAAKGVKFSHQPRLVSRGDDLELWKATFRDPDGHGIALTEWRPREP